MDKETFKTLDRGDIIKHVNEFRTFVVTANYGERITAVSTVDMTNPLEWKLVKKQVGNLKKETPLEINRLTKTCMACPSQWEFFTFDKRPVYVRYRWGYLSVRIGPPGATMLEAYDGKEIIGKQLGDSLDGSIIWPYVEQQLNHVSKECVTSILGDV